MKKRTVITYTVMGHIPQQIVPVEPPGNHCASHRAFCAKKLTSTCAVYRVESYLKNKKEYSSCCAKFKDPNLNKLFF